MALEKRTNPVDLEAEKLLKDKKVEKVEMRKEQLGKIENIDEQAEQYVKSLEGRMGGPIELRQEIPSKFEQPRQEIIKTSTEMIEAVKSKKGISLEGAGPVKKNVLEALSSLKPKRKAVELDIWGQIGGRAEKIAM